MPSVKKPSRKTSTKKFNDSLCKKKSPNKLGFTMRAHCKAIGAIKRSDGTKRKSAKYAKKHK